MGRAHGLELLRELIRIRRFEERAAELYSLAKIRGFLHLYIGEEAAAVGVLQALGPDDSIVATCPRAWAGPRASNGVRPHLAIEWC